MPRALVRRRPAETRRNAMASVPPRAPSPDDTKSLPVLSRGRGKRCLLGWRAGWRGHARGGRWCPGNMGARQDTATNATQDWTLEQASRGVRRRGGDGGRSEGKKSGRHQTAPSFTRRLDASLPQEERRHCTLSLQPPWSSFPISRGQQDDWSARGRGAAPRSHPGVCSVRPPPCICPGTSTSARRMEAAGSTIPLRKQLI